MGCCFCLFVVRDGSGRVGSAVAVAVAVWKDLYSLWGQAPCLKVCSISPQFSIDS